MTWVLWSSFAVLATANIITPGPAILNIVRRAVQLGVARTVPTIVGNALGLAVAGGFCAAGVAAFVLASELLWVVFRLVGIAYLAWLGFSLIIRDDKIELRDGAEVPVSNRLLFLEAFSLAVTNPKAILFFVALFPQFIDPRSEIVAQAAVLVGTFCVISILSLSTYSVLASALRDRFMTQARYRMFRIVSGVTLLGFAGKLARESR